MAKEYSWFKFKLPDWMMGRIQKQKPEVRGVFLNLACKYWQKQCKLSIEDAKEELEEVDYAYDSLVKKQIIKEHDGMVLISFLDEQWAENMELFEKQSKGGKTAAAKRIQPENHEDTTKSLPSDYEDTSKSDDSNLEVPTKVLDSDLQGTSCIKNEIREDKNESENREEEIEIDDSLSDASEAAPTEKKDSIKKWIDGFDKRKVEFQESLYPFTKKPPKYNGNYEPEMVKAFFEYWSEPNKSRSKMKWETETTWDLNLRLTRWANNPINNKDKNQNRNVHQTTIPAAKSGFRVQSGK